VPFLSVEYLRPGLARAAGHKAGCLIMLFLWPDPPRPSPDRYGRGQKQLACAMATRDWPTRLDSPCPFSGAAWPATDTAHWLGATVNNLEPNPILLPRDSNHAIIMSQGRAGLGIVVNLDELTVRALNFGPRHPFRPG